MARRQQTPGPGARGQAVPWEPSRPARAWRVSLGRSHQAAAPELVLSGVLPSATARLAPGEAAGLLTAHHCAGRCHLSRACLTLNPPLVSPGPKKRGKYTVLHLGLSLNGRFDLGTSNPRVMAHGQGQSRPQPPHPSPSLSSRDARSSPTGRPSLPAVPAEEAENRNSTEQRETPETLNELSEAWREREPGQRDERGWPGAAAQPVTVHVPLCTGDAGTGMGTLPASPWPPAALPCPGPPPLQ